MKLHPTGNPERGGILFKLFAFLLVCLALLTLAWMLFLPTLIAQVISSRTGFAVRIESLSVNPFTARVSLRGLVLKNSEEFTAPDFLDLGEFKADAELSSLWGEKLIIEEASVHVRRLALVKGRGTLNNAVLFRNRLIGESSSSAPEASQAKAGDSGARSDLLIRKLHLRFDKLALVDATGPKPTTREYNIDLDQHYEGVTSATQIATPIVGRLVSSGGVISDYAGTLGTQAMEGLRKTGELLKDAGRKTGATLKDIFQSITEKPKK